MSYIKGFRHGADAYINLGRELNQVERCVELIRGTGVVDDRFAAAHAKEMVRALRRATRAAEMIRFQIESGDLSS